MKEWYFWTGHMPSNINTANYSSNNELLDAIINKPLDRWSYITTREQFNRSFTGQNAGHGFGWGFDENEHLYLLFVYKEAPAGKDNWQRGWRVLEINNKPIASYRTSTGGYNFQLGPNDIGLSNTFKFLLPDGTETTRTIDKQQYQANSVLHKSVTQAAGKNIGYWVYNSFRASPGVSPTRSLEVDESMKFFMDNNIDELIIDLRYNGGGSVAVTEQILNHIVSSAGNGRVMYTNQHNYLKNTRNTSVNFSKVGTLNLNRLIVITSRSSASASELLVNCLTPYMDVVMIGANTYGKPVGSFPISGFNRTLEVNDVHLVPITFALANAQGRAEYFEGFPVNHQVADDPARNWGNPEERRFQSAVNYILTGSVGSPGARTSTYEPKWEMIDAFHGLEKEFPAY